MSDVLRVPVFVEDWQIECCGTPPAVGDHVEWVLVLDADGPGDEAPDELAVTLDAWASPYPVGDGSGSGRARVAPANLPTRLDSGELHVLWRTSGPRAGPVRVRGSLVEEHHGGAPEGFPPTSGTVARVRVVTRQFVPSLTQKRMYHRGDAPPRYRDVDRSPKSFAREPERDGAYWADSGVLVDLVIRAGA